MKVTTTQMYHSRPSAALPVFLLLALLLLALPDSFTEQLRVGVKALTQPLLRLTSTATHGQPVSMSSTVNAAGQVSPTSNAQAEIATAELVRLRNLLQQYQKELPPNDGQYKELPGVNAGVIARRAIWQEPTLGLNKGSADGLRVDAGVTHRGAVAGRIVAVGPHASSMALLTHRGMTIGARLLESRIEGILQGCKNSEGTEQLCRLQIAARELNATVGEQVVTSGLDGVFPPGLWIGKVIKIKKTGDFQWELDVQPVCDETRVESVRVLTIQPPEVPWPVLPKK